MHEDYLAAAEKVVRKIMVREIWSDHPDQESGNSPLHNFARAFKGAGDYIPASYAQECLDYEKKQRQKNDGGVSIAVPGTSVVLQLDGQGNLTIMGGGRQHIEVPLALFDAGYQLLPKPGSIPDAQIIDANTDSLVPGGSGSTQRSSNLPMTNKQMSMIQNELALKAIKKSR